MRSSRWPSTPRRLHMRRTEWEAWLAFTSLHQAAAFARISFSSRRIRFSRRSRRSSSRSAVVSPSRRPSSTSAWFTQLRIVWSDGSNSRLSSPGVRTGPTTQPGTALLSSAQHPYLGLQSQVLPVSTKAGQHTNTANPPNPIIGRLLVIHHCWARNSAPSRSSEGKGKVGGRGRSDPFGCQSPSSGSWRF